MTKPDKIRETMYDMVVDGVNAEPLGRSKEGLVYASELDGSHLVVKVIKKKSNVTDLKPVTTYEEKLAEYEAAKAEADAENGKEVTEEREMTDL